MTPLFGKKSFLNPKRHDLFRFAVFHGPICQKATSLTVSNSNGSHESTEFSVECLSIFNYLMLLNDNVTYLFWRLSLDSLRRYAIDGFFVQ